MRKVSWLAMIVLLMGGNTVRGMGESVQAARQVPQKVVK